MRHIRPPARLVGSHLLSRLSHPSVSLSVCLILPPICLVALCLYAPRQARARPTLPAPAPAIRIDPVSHPVPVYAPAPASPQSSFGARNSIQTPLLDSPLIRIELTRCAASTLLLNAEPGAHLFGPDGREATAGMGPWTITLTSAGARAADANGHVLGTAPSGTCWRLQSEDEATILGIARGGDTARRYRGCLEVGVAGKRLYAVNETALETYLRGVIPCEIGGSAPPEAMKAQAVASRTFALYCLLRRREHSGGFADVRDTTDSQVYNGADAETPDSDAAVLATSGLILTVAEQPIFAQFCADCGGVTTPGATPNACPHSVDDSEAHGNLSRRSDWSLHLTPQQLADALEKKQPELRSLGTITAADVQEKDVSGRVRRLRLTWRLLPKTPPPQTVPLPTDSPAIPTSIPDMQTEPSSNPLAGGTTKPLPNVPAGGTTKPDAPPTDDPNGDPTLLPPMPAEPLPTPKEKPRLPSLPPLPPPVFREVAGNTLRALLGVNTFRSTLFTVRKLPGGDFEFDGKGWGHGRGMCQVGAMALASPPLNRDFRSILRHYYAGSTLSRLTCLEPEGDFTVAAVAESAHVVPAAARRRVREARNGR